MRTNRRVLLIHPPVVRPCEPPPGIARLAGCLRCRGVDCRIIDADLEGLLYLSDHPRAADTQTHTQTNTWTKRAITGMPRNLELIRQPDTLARFDRYRQAVLGVNRVLMKAGEAADVSITLSNYEDRGLSPVKSADLMVAFRSPEKTPFHPYFEKRLKASIAEARPDWVGLSINFLPQALCAFAMIGVLRQIDSEIRIVVGGGLITSWMKRPGWKNPFSGIIDQMVCGPGEAALLSLCGLDADEAPVLPDFDGFPLMSYLSPGSVLPFSASTGCYWRKCAFCPERAEQNPYRPIPPGIVVSQLHTLIGRHDPALIHLTDNALSPALLKALAGAGISRPWYGFVRITPLLADPDFCARLKRSGCVMLQIGLESGSQRVLDAFGKGVDLTVAARVLSALSAAGIATYVYLLFGTPWETEADAEMTLDFTVAHCPAISFLNLAVFNLPAHGPGADLLPTSEFYEGDLFLYRQFTHPAGWDRNRVRQFLDRRFKRHPAIARIIRADPPIFTSNHAPFKPIFFV